MLFYVCETSKWAFQPLYDLMSKNDIFEPFVVIGMLNHVARGTDKTRNNVKETFEFFKTRKMNVYMGVDGNKRISLKKFRPDIVFYEQQWELPKSHKPYNVSKYALTCYSYYSLPLFDYEGDYSKKFHKIVYRVFADSEENLKRYETYEGGTLRNYVVTGYSKLDVYSDNNSIDLVKIWKEPENYKIIYVPHHTFDNGGISVATFRENGRFILELAKKFPQTTWVFKPHPDFKMMVLDAGIMAEKEIEEYFDEWRKIGRVYTQGNYFDIF